MFKKEEIEHFRFNENVRDGILKCISTMKKKYIINIPT